MLIPYPELKISIDFQRLEIEMQVPWSWLRAKIEPQILPRVLKAKHDLDRGVSSGDLNWLLEQTRDYGFAQIIPQATDLPKYSSNALFLDPIEEISKTQMALVVADTWASGNWEWDLGEILQQSKIYKTEDDQYDPRALFAALTRYRCKSQIEHCIDFKKLERLEIIDEERFLNFAKIYLSQNYYVTHHAEKALAPAADLLESTRALIEDYIESERGHDYLVLKSLKDLGVSDPESYVLPTTRALMNTLEFCSRHHLVAFAMVVDSFENASPEETNPLAEILSKTKNGKKAARGIQAHRNINTQGAHDEIAQTFINQIGSLDRTTAIAAIRLSELESDLSIRLVDELNRVAKK